VAGVVEIEIDGAPGQFLVRLDNEIVEFPRFEIHRDVVEQSKLGAVGTHDGLPERGFQRVYRSCIPVLTNRY